MNSSTKLLRLSSVKTETLAFVLSLVLGFLSVPLLGEKATAMEEIEIPTEVSKLPYKLWHKNGLVAEPEAKAGNCFTGIVCGRPFNGLGSANGDAEIGFASIIVAPHNFNSILTLNDPADSTAPSHRYTAILDKATLPKGATDPEAEKSGYS